MFDNFTSRRVNALSTTEGFWCNGEPGTPNPISCSSLTTAYVERVSSPSILESVAIIASGSLLIFKVTPGRRSDIIPVRGVIMTISSIFPQGIYQ